MHKVAGSGLKGIRTIPTDHQPALFSPYFFRFRRALTLLSSPCFVAVDVAVAASLSGWDIAQVGAAT